MEENVLAKNNRNMYSAADSYHDVYQRVVQAKQPEPRSLIAKGVELSTSITDKSKVAELTDKALRGEKVAQNGNYDVFLFGIAESLEKIKCETSSINEYFGWIDETQQIMDHMTDGCVTPEDLAEKKEFIANSWQREAEILICLGLYERSNNPMAAQRVSEMTMKLKRLRQLRSALINNTKNKPDKEPLTPQEKARITALIQTLRRMRQADENGDYNNAEIEKELSSFNAAHINDVEFYSGYSFYTRLLDDQRTRDIQKLRIRTIDHVEQLDKLRHTNESKDDVRQVILRLTGRKSQDADHLDKVKSNEFMYSHHRQAFDIERFKRLKEMKEYDYFGE
ncbi:MAG: hypothetical protein IJ545_05180 [Alphaproteobacteria bacterium]|nr:hypothetical protein [Alphaproteobacteria bacterium]